MTIITRSFSPSSRTFSPTPAALTPVRIPSESPGDSFAKNGGLTSRIVKAGLEIPRDIEACVSAAVVVAGLPFVLANSRKAAVVAIAGGFAAGAVVGSIYGAINFVGRVALGKDFKPVTPTS